MLAYDVIEPGEAGDGTVLVLLHGRGADRNDMRGLAAQLPRTWTTVVPDAPHAAAPWGYGSGRAWYQYLGGTQPEPESFTASLAAVDALLDALPGVLPLQPQRVVLGGFSQGGTVSIAYALTRRDRVTNALNFSGFLAEHPDLPVTPGSAHGVRIFWGHGFSDPNIPYSFARDGQERLRAAGAELEARDYPIGHWIDPLEIAHAVAFVQGAHG